MSASYLNFDLLIDRGPAGYRARVIASPAGEAATDFALPFADAELAGFLERYFDGDFYPAAQPGLDAHGFGQRLYQTVFAGAVGRCLRRSLDEAGRSGAGLRIRLRFDAGAPELAELPWELLYAPDLERLLAPSSETPLVRYLPVEHSSRMQPVQPPLVVLAALSNPTGGTPLAVEREWQHLQEAVAGLDEGHVRLERAPATWAALQARLRQGPVHVLHFVGHGYFDRRENLSGLVFEDEVGQASVVPAEMFKTLLHDHDALRLVYLNACEGASNGRSDPFSGVAQQLVQQGVPAVVAMQFPISDAAAITLSREFYRALAGGYPVDAALGEARKAVLGQTGSPEWATPVLFSRSDDNRLFDMRDVLPAPDCPYPGMVPFRAEDARFFYGREGEIQQMLDHQRHQRLLLVIGPSGSGKSSLIAAGLLPRLEKSTYFAPGFWLVRTMRPLDHPVGALAVCMEGDVSKPEQAVAALLASHAPAQRLLLVIDQFEEAFSLADKAERQQFMAALQVLRRNQQCVLVIALRADFYPDLMNSELWPVDPGQRLDVAVLRGEALRQAIRQPAADVEVEIEEALIERLLADLAGEPGALPMLQETLVLLWERMRRRQITLDDYEQLGEGERSGLAVAVARKADAAVAELTPAEQAIAQRIFLRLIQFGEGGRDTRRQLPVADLRSAADDDQAFELTLEHLARNRLLITSGEEGGVRRVDIAHEALIAGSPRLQEWLVQRRAAEQTRRRLEAKAAEWITAGKRGGLLDEYELQEAENWLAEEDARELGTSRALADLVQASKEAIAQSQAKEAEAARSRQRSRLIAGGLALAMVFVALVGYFALTAQRERTKAETAAAEAQRQESEAGRLAALSSNSLTDRDIDRALLLSVESSRAVEDVEGLRPSITARSAVLAALQYEPYLVRILDLPTPEIDDCKAHDQELQLIHASLSKYDQGFADQYVAAARSCRPECLEAAQSDTEVSIAEVEPTTACLAACEDADGQLLDPYRVLAQRYIDTGRRVYGCSAAPNASFIAMNVTKEPLGAGGVGTVDTQLRLWRVPQWNVLDMEVVERCEPDMLETEWRFDQQSLRLSVWNRNDQETPLYQLILPGPSDDAGHYDNYAVKRVAVAPDKSTVAALVASGRFEKMLEIVLWDAETSQLIGTLYTTVAGNEVDGDLAYGLRLVGNSTAEVCHGAWDPLLAGAPFYDQVVRVTLQLDEQRWLVHACEAAGRNLSLEEWERYMSDIPYRVTCPQWPAGK